MNNKQQQLMIFSPKKTSNDLEFLDQDGQWAAIMRDNNFL